LPDVITGRSKLGLGAITIVTAWVASGFTPLLTPMVKEKLPSSVGVPDKLPPLMDKPGGKVPDTTDHVKFDGVPVAAKLKEYGTPTVPEVKVELDVMVGAWLAGLTVRLNVAESVPSLLVAVTVIEKGPVCVVEPDTTPVPGLKFTPLGKPLAVIVGVGTPVAVKVALTGSPAITVMEDGLTDMVGAVGSAGSAQTTVLVKTITAVIIKEKTRFFVNFFILASF